MASFNLLMGFELLFGYHNFHFLRNAKLACAGKPQCFSAAKSLSIMNPFFNCVNSKTKTPLIRIFVRDSLSS